MLAYQYDCPVCGHQTATPDDVMLGVICGKEDCRFEEGVDDPADYEGRNDW